MYRREFLRDASQAGLALGSALRTGGLSAHRKIVSDVHQIGVSHDASGIHDKLTLPERAR